MPAASDRYLDKVKLVGDAEKYWRPIHRAFDEKIRFLVDGEHYDDADHDDLTKDRRLARWLGQESFNVWRHEVATVTAAPSSVHARPLDEYGNADIAEVAVQLVENEVQHPQKLFEDVCEDVVGSASACGLGWASIEMLGDEGQWGELYYASGDPRNFMHDPSVKSIHDLKCKWVLIRGRMTIREAEQREGWRKSAVKQLRKDNGYDARFFRGIETDQRLMLHRSGGANEQTFSEDDEFTVYFLWEREPGEAERPLYEELEPEEHYMACLSCGWKSKPQEELGHDLADTGGPCPECGAPEIHKITAETQPVAIQGYPKLNVMVLAPYSCEEPLYDGPPEIAWRTYPFMHLLRYRHLFRPVGPSLADLNWWNQLCTDLVMTLAVERLMTSAPIWNVPNDGALDAYGERFEFTDENGTVLFRSPDVPVDAISLLEGSGMPAAWSAVYQNMQNALTSKTGIADFGLGPQQSRDIPASSVAQQVQQQEVPTAHYQRRYQREKGRMYGLIFDGIREYPPDRLSRVLGEDGMDAVQAVRACDMPNFEFYLSDAPDFSALDEARTKGAQLLIQTATQTPEWLDFIAQVNNVPPSVLRKVKQNLARMQQAEPQDEMGQPAGAGPGAGAAPAAAPGMGAAPPGLPPQDVAAAQ